MNKTAEEKYLLSSQDAAPLFLLPIASFLFSLLAFLFLAPSTFTLTRLRPTSAFAFALFTIIILGFAATALFAPGS
jgi:hypothetical protein